jgi:hypothetical protein
VRGRLLDELPLGFAWLLLGGGSALFAFNEGEWLIGLALVLFATVVLVVAIVFS